jgi:hypothetical protein
MVADWSRWLPVGFGHRAAGDASHKRQYLGNPDLYGHKGFFVAVTKDHQKMLMGSMSERIIDPLADYPFTPRLCPPILG